MTNLDMSRRHALKGAAVGAGAVVLAGCAPDHNDAHGIHANRVQRVPVDDPHAWEWDAATEEIVAMGPQDIALPQKLEPALTGLKVRTLHDGERIAFRLDWDDPDVNELTVRVDDYRDACAVLLLPGKADPALRTMGSATTPATLLHWKADWQRDIDHGRQGLAAVYPNRSIDVYPPLWNVAPMDVSISSYETAGATEWLPGTFVGNPMSLDARRTPVEKAIAYGFSTTTTAPTQNAEGHGRRRAGGWTVILSKPLAAADDGELSVQPGTVSTCAFAVWSGADGDAGSRKSPSAGVHVLSVGE